MTFPTPFRIGLTLAGVFCMSTAANADMVLSQVIVDFAPGKPPRDDIEVFNDGPERMYVSAEPAAVLNPGASNEKRVPAFDPDSSGILVSPQKLVLAPGERRIVRVAVVGERPASDRIYRIAIKPVAGPISASESAIKVFVGYDALVLVRPAHMTSDVTGDRKGRVLTLTNNGNTAQELFDGTQCDPLSKDCRSLPAKRLYAGESWQQTLPLDFPVSYKVGMPSGIIAQKF